MRKELDRLQTKVANFDVTTEYAQSTSDTTAPTTGWSTTKPAPEEGKFVWARNIMNMGYGDVVTEPFCIGDGLEHILSIDVEYIAWSDAYQSPPQSSEYWQTTAPSIQSGQYIWTRTKTVTTFGTNYTDPLRVTGIEGADGQDGVSIKGDDGKGFDFIYYTSNTAPSTPSDNVVRTQNQYNAWCDSPTPVDATHPYIYMSLRTTDNNGDWGHWSSPVKMSSIGEKGEDGEGFEIVFTRTNSDTPVPTFSNGQGQSSYTGTDSQGRHYQDADFLPTGWTDNQQGVDSDHQYEWASFRFKTVTNGNASWGNFNTPKIWATYSEDGTSSYIHIRYSDRNNPVNTSQVFTSPNRYIGIYVDNIEETNSNKTTYDNPSNIPYSWSLFKPTEGIDFDGRFLHMKYATEVTFNLDGSVDEVTLTDNDGEDAGAWLGTLFDDTLEDTSSVESYTWTKIEGNGISTIQEQYASSNNYYTAPTTGWNPLNNPLPSTVGVFYWTRNLITFTDGTSTTTNAICVSGIDGDGVHNVYYCCNYPPSDNTHAPHTAPSWSDIHENTGNSNDYGRWVEDPVEVTASNRYIYISTSTSYSFDSNHNKVWSDFSTPVLWSKYAVDGESITRVVNYYATSSSNSAPNKSSNAWKTNISQVTFDATNCYLWNYEKSYSSDNDNDLINETSAVLVGYFSEDGVGISSIVEYYATSSSDSTAPNSWTASTDTPFTMPVTDETDRYLWNYERINYTDGNHLDTKKRIIGTHGRKGDTGYSIVFAYYTSDNANYSDSPSGSLATGNNKGNNKWCDTPYPTSASYPYLYVSTKTTETGSTWSSASLMSKYGLDGLNGNHGTGYEYAYYTTNGTPNPSAPSTVSTNGNLNSWQDKPVAITDSATKIYISYRTVSNGQPTSNWSTGALFSIKGDKGDDGYSIDSIVNYYAVTTSTTPPLPSDWETDIDQVLLLFDETYKYLWNYEECYNDNSELVSTTGTDPAIIGVYGADGKGITSITEKYAKSSSSTNAPSSWSTSIPTLDATDKYMWNQTTIVYTKGADSVNTRVIGVRGENGYDGVGFEMVFKLMDSESPTWTNSNNPSTISTSASGFQTAGYIPFSSSTTNTWTNDPSGVSASHKYEFASVRTSDENGNWGAFSTPSLFSKFGEDGIGIEYIYRVNNSTTAPTFTNNQNSSSFTGTVNNKHFYDDDFVPTDWSDDPVSVSSDNMYCWVSQRTKVNGSWGSFSNPSIWAKYGEKGAKGDAGNGYEYAYKTVSSAIQSSDKPSGSEPLTTGVVDSWQKSPVAMTSTYKYMYISYRTVQGSSSSNWSNSALWSQFGEKGDTGESGKDGLGLEHIFYRSDNEVNWAVFDDDGVGNTTNTYQKNRCSTSVDSTGTLMTATGNWAYLYFTSSSKRYALDFCIEFDLVSTSGSSCKLNIYDDTTERRFNLSSTGHYVLYVTSTGLSGTCNGTNVSHDSGSPSGATRVSFYISDNTHTLKFKNLKIYSMNNNPHYWAVQSTTDDYVLADSGWTDDASGVDIDHKYEYCCIRRKEYLADGKTARWGAFDLPFLWAKYGEDGADGEKGDEGERGTRIIEITEPPTHSSTGWAYGTFTYYYRKLIEKVLSESGETEVKIGDYLKYDTTLYLVEGSTSAQVYLVETELSPDMDNIDASLLDGKKSSEFMESEPTLVQITQSSIGNGVVECRKLSSLVIINVRECRVYNTQQTLYGWETVKENSNTVLTLPSAYRPSYDMINGAGTNSANSTNEIQLKLDTNGNLSMKNNGFANTSSSSYETVSTTFVYFVDTRASTSLTNTTTYKTNFCSGDYLEVQLKSGSTNLTNKEVIFHINGVSYTRTTDSNGKATLKVNLPKDTTNGYDWGCKYNGDATYKPCRLSVDDMLIYGCGGTIYIADTSEDQYPNKDITGTVKNNHGQPVANVIVTAHITNDNNEEITFSSVTNKNGIFHIYHPNDGLNYNNSMYLCTFSTDTVYTSNITTHSPSGSFYIVCKP